MSHSTLTHSRIYLVSGEETLKQKHTVELSFEFSLETTEFDRDLGFKVREHVQGLIQAVEASALELLATCSPSTCRPTVRYS